jgi:hypothetical protein
MQFPQIPSGPAGQVAWDPDNHVYMDLATQQGFWPYGRTTLGTDQPLSPGVWIDAGLEGGISVPLRVGTYWVFYKATFQDQSGTVTNHIHMRFTTADASQILDQVTATPVANGYVTLMGMLNMFTPGGVQFKLQVFGTAAGRLLGVQFNVPTTGMFLMLHLSDKNIGN